MDIYDYSMVRKIRLKAVREKNEEIEEACFVLLGRIHKSLSLKEENVLEGSSELNSKEEVMENKEIRTELLEYLGGYGPQLYDGYCGECVAWGYKVTKHCGDDVWRELGEYGKLECDYPDWFLITESLTLEKAIEKYGRVSQIKLGPRGGFKNITLGDKEFCTKELDPRDTIYFNENLVVAIK